MQGRPLEPEPKPDLEDLVTAFIEARERGEAVDASSFAARHPAVRAELEAVLRGLESTEALFPRGFSDLPERVGAYRVLGEVGRGGMGRVLRVEAPGVDGAPPTIRALKRLHDSLQHDPRALERFRREGEALERVRHPSVVRLFETGLDRGRPYLVMELVEGESLAARIAAAREGRTEVELVGEGTAPVRAARLVAQIARAVQAAQTEGVLHRDLNPRNVLLRPDGRPVVVDFGLVHAEGSDTLTVTGDVVGTPQYMAPEQALGLRVDPRADVFGLGAILYELLTREPPRPGDEPFALLHAASTRPVPDPRKLDPRLPRNLARIVRKATGFDPAWRYPTPGDLAFDLEAIVDGRPLSISGIGPVRFARESWMLHRRALLLSGAALGFVGAPLFYWAGSLRHVRPEEIEFARIEFLVAWLDGDLEEAQVAQRRLEELDPDDRLTEFYRALARGELLASSEDPMVQTLITGETYRSEGRNDEALEMYDIAWKFQPDTLILPLLAARAYLAAGRFDKAHEAYQHVVMQLFASTRIHLELSEAFEGAGHAADVVLARQTARQTDAADAYVALELARAYAAAGEPEKAVTEAARARTLDPSGIDARVARRVEELQARGAATAAADLAELFERAPD